MRTDEHEMEEVTAFVVAVLGVLAALVCGGVLWLALLAIGG